MSVKPAKKRHENGQVFPDDRRHERGAKLVLLHQVRLREHAVRQVRFLRFLLELFADLGDGVMLDRGQELVGPLRLPLADGPSESRAGDSLPDTCKQTQE